LSDALRQAVQDPNQPQYQEAVGRDRAELLTLLREAPSNEFSPAWTEALVELEIAELLGNRLAERIEEIFTRNEITLSAAADEVAPLATQLQELQSAINNLSAGFDDLGISSEELEAGDFEIGFLIPRRAVNNELKSLGEEFEALERILGPFLELSTGGRPDVEVRSIASSEFQVFLDSLPATAFLLTKALDQIISSIEKIYNIRMAHQQLKESGVDQEALDQVARDAESRMEKDIEALTEDLLSAGQVDDGRANELRQELKLALNGLANRLDDGYNIEIRPGELPEPDEINDEGGEDPVDPELRRQVEAVKAAREKLGFMNLSGDSMLRLPESVDTSVATDEDSGGGDESKPDTEDSDRS
jgi:hypothetical protein